MNPERSFTWDEPRRRFLRTVIALVGLLALVAAPIPSDAGRTEFASLIVRGATGSAASVAGAVHAAGGVVERPLPIIDGVAARVPRSNIAKLAGAPGVVTISANAPVRLTGQIDGYDPNWNTPVGSWKKVAETIRAKDVWKAGYLGQGVDVAVIDSGVAPVEGVQSKLVYGPDLSFESQAENLRNLDTYGHGTHIAGIIAGRDSRIDPAHEDEDLDKAFVGIAPRARIVSLKVATYSGATDVSQVIAAIDWVVQHRNANGLNIRVLNLSFGTDSTQPYTIDPLAHAAEVAWRSGIVVVVAAGNSNFGTSRLNDPAFDPYVIAVGADDTLGTNDPKDDVLPSWSARGDSARRPDLVAPGRSIVSLRSGGSYIDRMQSGGRVGLTRFFKGSGTSQAAAIVSGAAALLLSQRPGLAPDQVKYLLKSTAVTLPKADLLGQGEGLINVKAAKDAPTPSLSIAGQSYPRSIGTGSLELSRGSVHVSDGDTVLSGEQDIFGASFDSAAWASASLAGNTWSGGNWNGNTWTGNTWSGNTWSGNTWSGNTWSGNTWSGNTWSGTSWSGNTWCNAGWSGSAWSSSSWELD